METVVNDVYIVKPYDPNIIDCCVYLVDTKSDDGLILIDAGNRDVDQVEEAVASLKDGGYLVVDNTNRGMRGKNPDMNYVKTDLSDKQHTIS